MLRYFSSEECRARALGVDRLQRTWGRNLASIDFPGIAETYIWRTSLNIPSDFVIEDHHGVCSQDFLYGDKTDGNPTPQGDIGVSFGPVNLHTAHELGIFRPHTAHELGILRSKSISTSADDRQSIEGSLSMWALLCIEQGTSCTPIIISIVCSGSVVDVPYFNSRPHFSCFYCTCERSR